MFEPEIFLEVAQAVTKLKMWPYFDIAHVIMSCLVVREDMESDGLPYSRKHPMSCWLAVMTTAFAGGFLSCLLLGEAMLTPFRGFETVLLSTLVWYCMFYSPFDITYKVAKFLPVKVVLASMKEVYRAKKVYDGVSHAWKLFPNAWIILVITGVIKGNGAGFVRMFERLMRGSWSLNEAETFELLQPSFYTKSCALASVIFILNKRTDIISAPHALVYFCIVLFFVYFKVSAMLLDLHDPLTPFENLFCFILFGGAADALQQFVQGTKKSESDPVQIPVPAH